MLTSSVPKKALKKVWGLILIQYYVFSAREGIGIDELLEKIIEIIPAPKGKSSAPLKALIFDSYFDQYVGVVTKVRNLMGRSKKMMKLCYFHTKAV
jgi:GTP-binding protein LepA